MGCFKLVALLALTPMSQVWCYRTSLLRCRKSSSFSLCFLKKCNQKVHFNCKNLLIHLQAVSKCTLCDVLCELHDVVLNFGEHTHSCIVTLLWLTVVALLNSQLASMLLARAYDVSLQIANRLFVSDITKQSVLWKHWAIFWCHQISKMYRQSVNLFYKKCTR